MMHKHRNITLERLEKFHTTQSWTDVNLRSMLYSERIPVQLEVYHVPNGERIPFSQASKASYTSTSVGQSFGPSWSTHWFRVTATIPSSWSGREVHLRWDATCEGCVFLKGGEPMQGLLGGDGADRRAEYIVTLNAVANDKVELFVELAANGMFGNGAGGLINGADPNRSFELKIAELAVFNRAAWDLLWDFTVIADIAKELPENDPRGAHALYTANAIQNAVWTDKPETVAEGRKIAQKFLSETSGERFNVHAIGHCHIDTAWLWPYAETHRKVVRSWATQLLLMEQFPWYKFAASQAQQYEWLKDDQPKLYARLKKAVEKGSFVPIGGTWVEMDCNLPSGESFCRQFLYGQRFFRKEFGQYCEEFWLPDTFGYSAQLPQIIRGSSIKYFLTQKLSWNNINKFPHHTFWWQGLDASRVLTHFPPADTYCSHVSVKDILYSMRNFKDKERSRDVMLLFGHGDGGGGPQGEMLERMKRMNNLQGLPTVTPKRPADFFRTLEQTCEPLLTWQGELYFELHRGTYTSQARTKLGNRLCEFLLRDIEIIAAVGALDEYPSAELDKLWKTVLLNQFHDVLPGSSITAVYDDAHKLHDQVLKDGRQLLQSVLTKLHSNSSQKRSKSDVQHVGKCCFNTLGWVRNEVLSDGSFVSVPPFSFGVSHLPEKVAGAQNIARSQGDVVILENTHLRASFSRSGHLTSLVHKKTGRETMKQPGNSFVIFDDVNLFWDAWDAEVFHLEKRHNIAGEGAKVTILQNSEHLGVLQISFALTERSSLVQKVFLNSSSVRLDFETVVDWDENRKFLKVEFPTTVLSPVGVATFETQFGHLQRPTHRNTSWDMARFEVCAHKWADLSEYGFGVALLNNCKYGYAVEDNVIRLSLLRSPKAPDPSCDIGKHHFTYSIMPHAGSFQEAGVIQEGYNLNVPLVELAHAPTNVPPSSSSFFEIDNPAVVLETVKKSEDGNALILRLYEAFGSHATFKVRVNIPFTRAETVNLLEESGPVEICGTVQAKDREISGTLSPFKILTIKLSV